MKFSIITVSYNSEKTIERTMKSVLAQTYPYVEYIIIDGKSTDNTMKIVNEYENRFNKKGYEFKYISESDRGIYDAMNKGIKYSSGDVISMLNSDDWYEENTLNIVASAIGNNEGFDIYMGSIRVYNGNHIFEKHARNRKYKTSRDFNHPAMFVTKNCYETVGEYGISNIHNDYGWYLRATKLDNKVFIIDDVLTNYPTGGAGSKKSLKHTFERIKTKYKVYSENGYSKFYFFECMIQEFVKFVLLKG